MLTIVLLQRIRHSSKLRVQMALATLLLLCELLLLLLLLHAVRPASRGIHPAHLHGHLVTNLLQVLHVLLVTTLPLLGLLAGHAGLSLRPRLLLLLLLLAEEHLHLWVHVLDYMGWDVAVVGSV